MIKLEITNTLTSEMAAKMLAVVVPRTMAVMAWTIVQVAEERGLIRMSQTA